MSTIFISYRRDGALVHARALFERLSREFGQQQVFIDLDGIDIGVDFVELIDRQLEGCRVLLALIDPDWLDASDREGRRRLDNEADFVRIEIARALRRGITVAPILLDGAEMPSPNRLPTDLQPLARRNAMALDFRRFDSEVSRLIATIRRILDSAVSEPPAARPASAQSAAVERRVPAPRAQAAREPPRQAVEPKANPAVQSTAPAVSTSHGSVSVAGAPLGWAAVLILALVVAFAVWSFTGRSTGGARSAADAPATSAGTTTPVAEPATTPPAVASSTPTEPASTPSTSAAPPQQDPAPPVGKRWVMEFVVSTRAKACGMVAADPDFAAATIWQHDVDPRFPSAPAYTIRFGPTTDRPPLDVIRKRYLDQGMFSVITAPRSGSSERRVDCQSPASEPMKIKV